MAISELITVNFEQTIHTKRYVIIDFYADWCGPCKMLSPTLNNISDQYQNINFFKVNVDRESVLAKKLNIQSIPTVLFFRDSKLVDMFVGYKNQIDIKNLITKFLSQQ